MLFILQWKCAGSQTQECSDFTYHCFLVSFFPFLLLSVAVNTRCGAPTCCGCRRHKAGGAALPPPAPTVALAAATEPGLQRAGRRREGMTCCCMPDFSKRDNPILGKEQPRLKFSPLTFCGARAASDRPSLWRRHRIGCSFVASPYPAGCRYPAAALNGKGSALKSPDLSFPGARPSLHFAFVKRAETGRAAATCLQRCKCTRVCAHPCRTRRNCAFFFFFLSPD